MALSARKLVFFIVASIIWAIVTGVMMTLAFELTKRSDNARSIVSLLVLALAAALMGVVAGGVVHLVHAQREGRPAGIGSAFLHCIRRFVPLFLGMLALFAAIVAVFGLVSWVVFTLDESSGIGALLMALLYLPQWALNLTLLMGILVSVLMPCIVVVDQSGPLKALARMAQLLRTRLVDVIIHFAITLVLAWLVIGLLGLLVASVTFVTSFSNGGGTLREMIEQLQLGSQQADSFEAFLAAAEKQKSDSARNAAVGLRAFFVLLLLLIVLAYPAVYGIASFTDFYRAIRGTIPRAGP